MLTTMRREPIAFPHLSYANASHSRLKRSFIRAVEGLSGRDRYARPYDLWRRDIVPSQDRIFARMLELIGVSFSLEGAWPPADIPEGPLVIVANHPFGIGDGIAILSLAERLDRPFRVMINAELLKVSEIAPFSLPVDFSETKDALKNNMAVRHEALKLLRDGVTILIFPAGGVATAPKGFGQARDLPWKMFPARLVQEAKASVIPVHFRGQNGRLFHLVSGPMTLLDRQTRLLRIIGGLSLTLRTSLLIREFTRLSGKRIEARVGPVLSYEMLAGFTDRKALTRHLHDAVFSLAPERPQRDAALRRRLAA